VGRPSIFICYRRTDSGWAGRLQRELTERFGSDAVFRDSTIPAGEEWQTHIDKALDACKVVLVMIGPSWTERGGRNGRLWDSDDMVRREIQRALLRSDVQVIPVLFDGAAMPARNDLPAELHRLLDRQAINLSDLRWDYDTGELGERIATSVHQIVPRASRSPDRLPTYVAVAMIVAAAVGGLVASRLALGLEPDPLGWPPPSSTDVWSAGWLDVTGRRLAGIAVHYAILWGIVGGLIFGALHLALRDLRAGAPVGTLMGVGSGVVGGFAGALVYVLLKDALRLELGEIVLNGAAVAAAGGVLATAIAPLLGEVDRSIQTTIGLVGGMIAGSLGGAICDEFAGKIVENQELQHGPFKGTELLTLAWGVQALVLVGCLATMITVARLEPAMSPATVET
jgi:hypothetical protein